MLWRASGLLVKVKDGDGGGRGCGNASSRVQVAEFGCSNQRPERRLASKR